MRVIFRIAIALVALFPASPALAAPQAVVAETSFRFGRVARGTLVRHDFVLENHGNAALILTRAIMTAPLTVQRLPRIEAGRTGTVAVTFDTSTVRGSFNGELILLCNDPVIPEIRISVAGEVFETVELAPLHAFFIATTRDTAKEQSIEIINHEAEPLQILRVEHSSGSLTTRLETVEEGRRYRLTVVMSGTGPAGKHTERIRVHTSSPVHGVIPIAANTWLRERVFTFPDEVDMGAVPFDTISRNPEVLGRLTQALMVYQVGGKAFEVTAHTDLPGISVTAERGRQGDRWQLNIGFRTSPQPGLISGSIIIETNDPEFKTLTVPVRGAVVEK